jgi:predicted aldo/keto reductase-like oxidoreductase
MLFARDRAKKVFLREGSGRYAGATKENFSAQLAESLRRLRTDYIDILYLHSCEGPEMSTYEPMTEAFVKAKASGKARFIGISTHTDEPETIRAAVDAGVWDVILTAYNFIQEHKEEVRNSIRYAAEKGLGVIAMKTQGGVRLNREKKIEVNHAAALKWVLNDKNVSTTIPGITTFDQLDLDFGVMNDLPLSDQEKRDLNMSSMLRTALYCQQCRACVASCPKGVEIPSLMRAYMYAEGYGNLIQAQMTVDELPASCGLNVCRGCERCTATCPQGIEIQRRLDSLMAMTSVGHGAA